jgi:hypothetical protein
MSESIDAEESPPPFDAEFARGLVGRYVLIGVTVQNKNGEFLRQEQYHGVVTIADPKIGINVLLKGTNDGQEKNWPPATHVFQPAPEGEYRLRSTGETVLNPDYTATWVLTKPDA